MKIEDKNAINITHKDLKQLKSVEVSQTREEILKLQNNKCAICGKDIKQGDNIALDHQHKTSKETIGEDGAGLIRGVVHSSCNIWEGKIWNNTQRFMQPKNVAERIEILQKLIEYYESGTYSLVHPSEKQKDPIVSKRNYNKLKKIYQGKRKFPEYPKSGKLTLGLQKLFEEYNIEPFN